MKKIKLLNFIFYNNRLNSRAVPAGTNEHSQIIKCIPIWEFTDGHNLILKDTLPC